MYVILGGGRVGARVAELLQDANKPVHLVDKDPTRVEALQERRFPVTLADMVALDFLKEPFRDAEAFLLLARDDAANARTLVAIKKALPHVAVIARASTQGGAKELKEAGANYVIVGPDVVGNAVVKELTELELFKKTDELQRIVKDSGEGGLGIFLHDSPDPDSIAAGMALQKIAEKLKVKSFIYYGGKIGHQQNRTLVNLLGIRMKQITPGDDIASILKRHPKTALLDCEIPGQNNVLPRNHGVSIVIGHHLSSVNKVSGEFIDVRQNVGAVSTIVLGYLQELGIVPDPKLAAALLHGIRVDTMNLTRHTSPSDLKAVAYLSPLVDQKLLEQIENPPMTNETLDVMGRAIVHRQQRGAYLVSSAGYITDRDSLPQAAEFMLNLEGVNTVLVFGIQNDHVHLSSRSRDTRINLGEVLQRAFGEQNAGGHAQAAGGAIPLGILGSAEDRDELLQLVERAVAKEFFAKVGAPEPGAVPEEEPEPEPEPPVSKPNGTPRRRASRRTRAH
jgi:nanoRNase/pAp phosphatase (c-di-AMP/oligoRNAs hydrolase)